jgi:hypothetical protein
MKRVFKAIIRLYQLVVSPIFAGLGARCRFYPTCSEYAVRALEEKPCGEALLLIGKRLLKCGPWHEGGIDHPPGARS